MKKQISLSLMALLILSILCIAAIADRSAPTLEIKELIFSEVLYAEQEQILSITIKNAGPGNAHDLTIKLEGDSDSLLFESSTKVPPISRGQTQTVEIPVAGKKELSNNDEARIRIRLIDEGHNQEVPYDEPLRRGRLSWY